MTWDGGECCVGATSGNMTRGAPGGLRQAAQRDPGSLPRKAPMGDLEQKPVALLNASLGEISSISQMKKVRLRVALSIRGFAEINLWV